MPLIPPPTKIPLPIQEVLKDFFVDLLGKGAAASKAKEMKLNPDSDRKLVVSVWEDKWNRIGAICVAEQMMAAIAGAALVMAPASSLGDIEKSGELPENLLDNYNEVVNILSSVMNQTEAVHLRLKQTFQFPDEELPKDLWAVVEAPSNRRDFDLTVEGYGSGKLSILAR
jgi:hypothetical protein